MQENQGYDMLFKIVLIGDNYVGKSCILRRLLSDSFNENISNTIGVEFGSTKLKILGKTIKMQIWDTAGQEKYRTITTSYFRNIAGVVLVYDITNHKSFKNCENWLKDLEAIVVGNRPVVVMVGNKNDMEATRQVTTEEGEQFAKQHNLLFLETSAKSKNSNRVYEIFCSLGKQICCDIKDFKTQPDIEESGIKRGVCVLYVEKESNKTKCC